MRLCEGARGLGPPATAEGRVAVTREPRGVKYAYRPATDPWLRGPSGNYSDGGTGIQEVLRRSKAVAHAMGARVRLETPDPLLEASLAFRPLSTPGTQAGAPT